MKALRLLTHHHFPNPTPSLSLPQRLIAAVFSSSSAAANPRFSNSSFDEDDEEGSAVYRHKLKFQRPTTIELHPWRENKNLYNSASFIGTVLRPLRVVNTVKGSSFGVHTLLSVQTSLHSDTAFWILLMMWEEMAKLCMKHLKPNDFIHVSGQLRSNVKADQNGNSKLYYKLVVEELNYVAQHGQESSSKNYEEPQSDGGEAYLDKSKDRLRLWQLFLANPYEWWDNRKEKKNPKQPDFKHKDTGEALWLHPDDPPWIKRQLELLDMRMPEQGHAPKHSRVFKWEYDE